MSLKACEERIADLERRAKETADVISKITAQREAEAERANFYQAILNTIIGAIDVMGDGAQLRLDRANETYHQRVIEWQRIGR